MLYSIILSLGIRIAYFIYNNSYCVIFIFRKVISQMKKSRKINWIIWELLSLGKEQLNWKGNIFFSLSWRNKTIILKFCSLFPISVKSIEEENSGSEKRFRKKGETMKIWKRKLQYWIEFSWLWINALSPFFSFSLSPPHSFLPLLP